MANSVDGPFIPPMMWNPLMDDLGRSLSEDQERENAQSSRENQARAVQEMQDRMTREIRGFTPGPPAPFKR